MPLTSIRRALPANPNDSCSNDSENMNNGGPCRLSFKLDLSWSVDTEPSAESAVSGDVGSISGYNTQNGYMVEEQWISCVSDSELNLNGGDYLVEEFNFIYEIYTPIDDDTDEVLDTLANFERNLSLGVFEALGLVHCAGSETQLSVARSAGPWLRRSLTSLKNNHRLLDDDATSDILAVSMMPKDDIDYASACTSAVKTDEPAACSHVVGGMTAWINKADGASAIPNEDVFLNAVESYIKDDNSKYLGNGLVHVEYIGELDTTTYTTTLGASDVSSGGPSSTGSILGLALGGAFFAVAGFGGAWFYRKKRNKNQDELEEKSEVIVKDDDDIQLQDTAEITSFDDPPSVETDSSDARTADYQLKRVGPLV